MLLSQISCIYKWFDKLPGRKSSCEKEVYTSFLQQIQENFALFRCKFHDKKDQNISDDSQQIVTSEFRCKFHDKKDQNGLIPGRSRSGPADSDASSTIRRIRTGKPEVLYRQRILFRCKFHDKKDQNYPSSVPAALYLVYSDASSTIRRIRTKH